MKPTELTLEQMEDFIGTEGIAVLDFWAPWCGPCKTFGPIFEKVAEKNPQARWGKVNTEQQRQLAQMFQIRSIPTLMLFRDGVLLMNQPGLVPEAALEDILKQAQGLDMDDVRRQIAEKSSAAG